MVCLCNTSRTESFFLMPAPPKQFLCSVTSVTAADRSRLDSCYCTTSYNMLIHIVPFSSVTRSYTSLQVILFTNKHFIVVWCQRGIPFKIWNKCLHTCCKWEMDTSCRIGFSYYHKICRQWRCTGWCTIITH